MSNLEEVQNNLGASKLFLRKEINELAKVLFEDEVISKIISGKYNKHNAILAATNIRLLLIYGEKNHVIKVDDFSYDKISLIQYESGFPLGKIIVLISDNKNVINGVITQEAKDFADYVMKIKFPLEDNEPAVSTQNEQPAKNEKKPQQKIDRVITLKMIDGIPAIAEGSSVSVSLIDEEEKLEIKPSGLKTAPSYFLNYSQIVNVDWITKDKIVAENKSVIGRAAVGGLLLGPLGAIVGGMSGAGAKQRKDTGFYLVINYKSIQDEDIKVIIFEDTSFFGSVTGFVKALKKRLDIIQVPAIDINL